MENIVIIGNGPAGCTAGVYCARAGLAPTILTGRLPGGLLTQTTEVENFPGFPDGIQGGDLMNNMRVQAEKFGAKMIQTTVQSIEKIEGGFRIVTSDTTLETKVIIIATGSSPRWMGLPSEDRLKAKGVSACATCDGFFYRGLPVVVIGGGDSAMEEAEFLTRFASSVTVIHRRDELRASKIMADRALANPKITFEWNATVEEVLGENEVEGVRIKNTVDGSEKVIPCKGYFVGLGHTPTTAVFKGLVEMDEAGYILVKENSSYTSTEGIFAAGDCVDKIYRQAITAAGMGCKAGIDAERWLEANK